MQGSMSTRDELEATLRARPDDHTLLVYADLLQAQGDPRGELIALDLRPPGMSMQGIEKRRGQLLRSWLGDDFELQWDPEQQLWYAGELTSTYATFDCGFVDLFVTDEDFTSDLVVPKLLDAPAGEYLRRLSLSGPTAMLEPLLETLVARPRPWLQHLALSRPNESTLLVDAALGTKLAAATPNLEVLDLLGHHLLDRFTHPHLRELGITGCESIDLAAGAPLPSLRSLDFAFDADRPTPRGLFAPERVPALRRLCFSREEPGATQLFAALGTLGVAAQLTQLVLPSIRSPRDHALVQAGIDRMPMLREVEIARAYACLGPIGELRHTWARVKVPPPCPWPPREMLDRLLAIDGVSTDLASLVEVLEEQYDDLPEELRGIWYRFWTIVDNLEDNYAAEQAFSAGALSSALDALALPPHLAWLRDHLRERLAQRRQGFFATMRWI